MFFGEVSSWNLRDGHMVETLEALVAHLGRQGRRAKVTSKICHTGEGRCLWRKWVPACARKDEEGDAAVDHLIASEHYVAQLLNQAKLATLLVDLLTSEEEAVDLRTAQLRFDIGLLAERLVSVTDWLAENPETRHLRIGYFGASTSAGGRWWRRPSVPNRSAPSSRAAAALISLDPPSRGSVRRRC
jgi:hypothetical protein